MRGAEHGVAAGTERRTRQFGAGAIADAGAIATGAAGETRAEQASESGELIRQSNLECRLIWGADLGERSGGPIRQSTPAG